VCARAGARECVSVCARVQLGLLGRFVDFLLSGCGSQVDARDYFNNTALHFAARNGYGDVVELLLQAG